MNTVTQAKPDKASSDGSGTQADTAMIGTRCSGSTAEKLAWGSKMNVGNSLLSDKLFDETERTPIVNVIHGIVVKLDRSAHTDSFLPQASCQPRTPSIQLEAIPLPRSRWHGWRNVRRRDTSLPRRASTGASQHQLGANTTLCSG